MILCLVCFVHGEGWTPNIDGMMYRLHCEYGLFLFFYETIQNVCLNPGYLITICLLLESYTQLPSFLLP
jgi:hypothetical protein